jgi:hypothetical protein
LPTDESKVPHYFGPYPNWANSPFTLADAVVVIDPPASGTLAETTASVGGNGAITGITITNPGSGYTLAPLVSITTTGSGTGALAIATFNPTGSVTSVSVSSGGSGYTLPQVSISESGGGAGIGATATAFGQVDAISLVTPVGDPALATYHVPTIAFDLPDDPNGTVPTAHVVCVELNCSNPNPDGTPGLVTITSIVLDTPGSGYSYAPGVAILDGTQFDPIRPGGSGASVTATLTLTSVRMDTFGSGYTSAAVAFTDSAGIPTTDAVATATVEVGAITGITVSDPGSGYITQGGIKKFQDGLPVLCIPSANFSECTAKANNLGQYIPIAVPDTTTFSGANGFVDTDYYVIAVVQHRERMSSSLPATGTLLREYVQLETPANASISKHVALQTALLDGTTTPTLMPDGSQAYAVDDPHFLGPVIVAQRDRAVRIVFYSLLPTGVAGDLFLPTDTSVMGSGMTPGAADAVDLGTVMDEVRNPMCTEKYYDPMMRDMCFTENRATLHLHGGVSP